MLRFAGKTNKQTKKASIKSAGRLFLAAPGFCQGTDFAPSSRFLPGFVLVCSPFFSFFLSSFFPLLTEPSLSGKQSWGAREAGPVQALETGEAASLGCTVSVGDTGVQ